MAHRYMAKIFYDPAPQKSKPFGPLSYIINVWSLSQKLALILTITSQYIFKIIFSVNHNFCIDFVVYCLAISSY